MKVDILASGSSGNCIAITIGKKTILIDAGIAKTKIEKALMNVNIRPDQIEAIFITHAHGDHVKGLPIANKYQIPVYAASDEWQSIKNVDDDLQVNLTDKDNGWQTECVLFDYEGHDEWFRVIPFGVHHDSFDPQGYAVMSNDYKVSVCLDTGHVDSEMFDAMKNSNVYIIESNHEPRMVEVSKYPNSVKARILSHIGHLSNQQTADALSQLVQGKGEKIYLTHLSDKNNLPMLAESRTVKALYEKGFVRNKHYELEVM